MSVVTCSCSALEAAWIFLSFKTIQATLCSWVLHLNSALLCNKQWKQSPTDHGSLHQSTAVITFLSPWDLQSTEQGYDTALEHLQSATAVFTSELHKHPWTEKTLGLWKASEVPRSVFLWILEKEFKWLSQTLVPSPSSLSFTLNVIQIRLDVNLGGSIIEKNVNITGKL